MTDTNVSHQPRTPTAGHSDDNDDEYDVYLLYYSQNHILKLDSRSEPMAISSFSDISASVLPTSPSVESLPALRHLIKLPEAPPPTHLHNYVPISPEFVDGDTVRLGYSQLFVAGLRAKSRQITRKIDVFFIKAADKLRALKDRFRRRSLASA